MDQLEIDAAQDNEYGWLFQIMHTYLSSLMPNYDTDLTLLECFFIIFLVHRSLGSFQARFNLF